MVKRRESRGVEFLFALQNRDDSLAGGILISSAAYIILIKNGETACIGHIMKGILSLHDGRYMLFLIYAELYLGFYDFDWSGVWGDSRENGGSDQCRSGFRRRRSIIVYYDDRCDGFVGGTYGDRTEVRLDC